MRTQGVAKQGSGLSDVQDRVAGLFGDVGRWREEPSVRAANNDSFVRTKIIATLGPASSSPEQLSAMFEAGLSVCRLNFSHGELAEHERTLAVVRQIAAERNAPICVIGDLCGPKIRLGVIPDEPLSLQAGQVVRIIGDGSPASGECLTVSYPRLADEVRPGDRVLIDDGLVQLVVRERRGNVLVCECVGGGELRSRKGVNLPDSHLSTPALTEKDRRDLAWALAHGVDYLAISFVRKPEDLHELKQAIKTAGQDTPVITKIEKPEALEHLDELISHSDAVLIARGDLGVETELWRVPLVQKDVVIRCRRLGVPVIVATQMLQSMIDKSVPTRAEVSDVANAIFEQVDAVMLSGETAVGRYPLQAVSAMKRIAATAGTYLSLSRPLEPPPALAASHHPTTEATHAVAHAAVQAAMDLGAGLVAVWSATGTTVRLVARHRLPMPVLGLTYDPRVYRRMSLWFGVVPVCVEPMDNPAKMAAALDAIVLERRLASPGDLIVVVTSTRPTTPGATDTVVVRCIGSKV